MHKLLLIFMFSSISTLVGMDPTSPRLRRDSSHAIAPEEQRRMDYKTPAQLTWANPQATQDTALHHPAITELQEKVLYTTQGIELARRHLEGRAASASNLEGLDLAGSSRPKQHALKLTALLNAKRNDDPRGFMLQETMCTREALEDWRAMLPPKPTLHREGWTDQHDQECAQAMLKTSKLAVHLKNQFLKQEAKTVAQNIQHVTISPDGQYVLTINSGGNGILQDIRTQKVIHIFTDTAYPYSGHRFSPNSKICIIQSGEHERGNWHHTTQQAFDLTTNQLIAIPQDVTTQQDMPVAEFSRNARYAVLQPKTETARYMGLYDTRTQKVIIKFPEMKRHWGIRVSISPDEKYCFFNTKEDLKLFDLAQDGQEVAECKTPNSADQILWAPDGTCCLVQVDVGQHYAKYHLYYPRDNVCIPLDTEAIRNPAPCFSFDGRYCYIAYKDKTGRIYDLYERKTIKMFEGVRIIDCEAPAALFSEDPEYPYCVVPILLNEKATTLEELGAKVAVFNLETRELVTKASNLENVLYAYWPQRGPYYFVHYLNPIPENYKLNIYPTLDIRSKKTHELVVHVNNARNAKSSHDGNYCIIEEASERTVLVDMVNERLLGTCRAQWYPLPDGRFLEHDYSGSLYQTAPADCNWNSITSQQLCLILYAALMYHKNTPLDFTKPSNNPLRLLFAGLDDQMQKYVARAYNIKL